MSEPEVETPLEHFINPDALIEKLDIAEAEGNKRYIAGYANIAGIVDSQNERVTLEALRKAWARWSKNPAYCFLNLLHTNIPIARVVFEPVTDSKGRTHKSGIDERGLYIVGLVRDDISTADEVWAKIERGDFRGYSIGGRNLDPQMPKCKDGVCIRDINDLELHEVSIVDAPANRASLFHLIKRDDLAVLADATKALKEEVLQPGLVKISKKPCPEGKHYHAVIDLEKGTALYRKLFEKITSDGVVVIDGEREDEEYVTLFDLAWLRPLGVLTEEERHGGFNPPPLPDEPKNQGETPLKEEDVIEEKTEESQDSETSEEPEPVDEEKTDDAPPEEEDEVEEAIAPITLETLAADLARVIERLGKIEKTYEEISKPFAGYKDFKDCESQNQDKDDPAAYCGKIKHQVEGTAKIEKAETPVKEVVEAIAEAVVAETPPEPVVETPPEPAVEAPLEPVPEPIVETPSEPVPEPMKEVITRGQVVPAEAGMEGLNLRSLRNISFKDINEARGKLKL